MASAPTYEPIAWQSLGSAAASITISSIPGTYSDLKLVLGNLTTSSGGTNINLIFNNDSATNYSLRILNGNGTSAAAFSSQNRANLQNIWSQGTSTTIPAVSIYEIFQYANTGVYKSVLFNDASDANGSSSATAAITAGLWRSTAAINSLNLAAATGNINAGTTVALYGIKAA